MRKTFIGVIFTALFLFGHGAVAQQNVWVQIAAERSLNAAQQTVRNYAGRLDNVNGFRMSSGWYGIAIGPFTRPDADEALAQLRATGQIPGDSYIAFSNVYRQQFWPVGAATLSAAPVTVDTTTTTEPDATPAVIIPVIPASETKQEARKSERLLNREERESLQVAMKWDGYYNAAIDGAFGPGTRNAMSNWQQANNFDPTGVLTTKQRRLLVASYQDMLNSIGLEIITENTAGIELQLPLAMVEFDRYEPPFAHFKPKSNSDVQVLLISQTGDQATLRGLYDIMQTLEIVPLEGERAIGENSFTLTGSNAKITSHTFAALKNGQVKGFTLIWPTGTDRRRASVIDAMRSSFTPFADAVLPDVYGDPNAAQSVDLLAGLSIRQPDISRSGFYIDAAGTVLTTSSAIGSCERITLDDAYEVEVLAKSDDLALLRPVQSLSPIGFAQFLPHDPRLHTEISVSGYSYGGVLGAPTLTFGKLADLRGLKGETGIKRLSLATSDGDAGGPVFDVSGSVMGMLLPVDQDNAQQLPTGVSFASGTDVIVDFLAANGLTGATSQATAAIAPEDLTIAAADMTVLVSCWN